MDTHLGAQLKRAREARGQSLQQIAARTKISVTALEAVERNDFSRLPGGIFGRSFVRAYAVEVGLDPDAVVVSFVGALEDDAREAAARQAVRPEITADDRRFLERQQRAVLWLRVGVVVFIIAAAAFVVWQLRGLGQDDPVPDSAVGTPAPANLPSGFAPPPSDPIGGTPTTDPAADSAAAGAADAAPAIGGPAAPAGQDAAPGPAGAAGAPLVFDLAVSGDCWIAYSVDGGATVAQLFRAGDRRRIDVNQELVLDVGNAGALSIRVNGRPARSLGTSGAHVRRRITRDNVGTMLQ